MDVGSLGKPYLDETHLVEEVPGVPLDEKYFLWHGRKIVWKGATKQAGEEWARDNAITIDAFYPFEP